MWISTEDLKRLMNNGMDDYDKRVLKMKIQCAEEREEERRQKKIAERNAFLAQVAELLREYPGKPLCPTDLQFMFYHRFGQQISCSKITSACFTMYLNTVRWANDCPEDLCHVEYKSSSNPKNRNDCHSYYTWTK